MLELSQHVLDLLDQKGLEYTEAEEQPAKPYMHSVGVLYESRVSIGRCSNITSMLLIPIVL